MLPRDINGIPEPISRLLDQGQHDEALREIEHGLLTDPQSIPLWWAKAAALSASGKREEVLSCYDQLIQIDPHNSVTYEQKAEVLESLDRDEEALQCYEKALEIEPANTRLLNLEAGLLHRLDRFDEALATYDRIDQLSPGDPDHLIGKGDAQLSAGRVDEALLAFERAAEMEPDSFGAINWDTRGDTLFERGDAERALQFYDRAIAADKDYAWAYRGKAQVLRKLLGQPDRALEQLDAALQIDPNNAWFYFDKGNIFYDRKDYKQSAELYRRATELDPKYGSAWRNLGLAQEALERYEDAALSAEKTIEIDPQSADAWVHKGFCLGSLNKSEEAMDCYREALRLNPDNFWANNNMGWELYRLDKGEQALPYFRKCTEINPAEPTPWLNEATSMVKLDRCHDALKRLHSGLDLVNDPHDLLAKMAAIYADSLFQHDQALEYYQQCLSTQPENVYVRCNLVECLIITGKYAEGRAEADKLTGKLAPEDACGLSLVVLASYALEGQVEDRARQFNTVLEHFNVYLSESIPRKQEPSWNFNGLINKVRASNIPAESKFLVLTAIDIQQGQLRNSALSFFAAAEREPQATCETPAALSSL